MRSKYFLEEKFDFRKGKIKNSLKVLSNKLENHMFEIHIYGQVSDFTNS